MRLSSQIPQSFLSHISLFLLTCKADYLFKGLTIITRVQPQSFTFPYNLCPSRQWLFSALVPPIVISELFSSYANCGFTVIPLYHIPTHFPSIFEIFMS